MLVGIDWNSFRKGNLYNAPHVVVFFYCVDTLYIDAESVMSVFQSPLFGKKKTKKQMETPIISLNSWDVFDC